MANYNQTGSVKDETELQKLKTGNKQSTWQASLDDAIGKILNREKFTYDLNGDALYQQYKDKYITQGQQAMMDTMGQAQAMTGGYGNSYAQMAGQQAYQGHLQQLNNVIPELYQLALGRYQAEGDDLANWYAILSAQEGKDYDRAQNEKAFEYQQGRDQIADKQWQAEFDEAVRQWNHANGIATAPASGGSSGGSGSGSSGSSGSWRNSDGTVNVEMINTNTDWWREYAAANGLDPATGKKAQPQDGPTGPEGPTGGDGFTGSTYSEAVAYMKQNGVSSAEASGVMTQSEWQRRKNAGSGSAEVKNYSSYKEYLADYVEYKTSN
jgi:hypothetical protein